MHVLVYMIRTILVTDVSSSLSIYMNSLLGKPLLKLYFIMKKAEAMSAFMLTLITVKHLLAAWSWCSRLGSVSIAQGSRCQLLTPLQ